MKQKNPKLSYEGRASVPGAFLGEKRGQGAVLHLSLWPANVCKLAGQHQGHGQLLTTE